MTSSAYAKIIISGEHSVVYGAPAITTLLPLTMNTMVNKHQRDAVLNIDINNLDIHIVRDIKDCMSEFDVISDRYNDFIKGIIPIQKVVPYPDKLLMFLMGKLIKKFNLDLDHGYDVKINSNIPMGTGLGSSAAFIISVIKEFLHANNINLTNDQMLDLARDAENLQHGKSSGIDILSMLHGELRVMSYFADKKIIKQCNNSVDFFVVNTGKPESTTGEAVSYVANKFSDKKLIEKFRNVTDKLYLALDNKSKNECKLAIHENQELLEYIGVTPKPVQKFIANVRSKAGAAKICGAGSVTGDNGGAVLVTGLHKQELQEICDSYKYDILCWERKK